MHICKQQRALCSSLQECEVREIGHLLKEVPRCITPHTSGSLREARVRTTGSVLAQAPLLVYNHFVEALFVLNDCRAGLRACAAEGGTGQDGPPAASQADASGEALSQVVGVPGGPGSLGGPSPQARAKRDAIYKCAAWHARLTCLTPAPLPVHGVACSVTARAQDQTIHTWQAPSRAAEALGRDAN